jgi:predicted HAD superfamily phosphohydrolase YqeG
MYKKPKDCQWLLLSNNSHNRIEEAVFPLTIKSITEYHMEYSKVVEMNTDLTQN